LNKKYLHRLWLTASSDRHMNCLNCNRLDDGLEARGLHVAPIKYYYIYVFELLMLAALLNYPLLCKGTKIFQPTRKNMQRDPWHYVTWDRPYGISQAMVFGSGKMGYPRPM
jgi:hypothetical protein